jgi:hypothetical protein
VTTTPCAANRSAIAGSTRKVTKSALPLGSGAFSRPAIRSALTVASATLYSDTSWSNWLYGIVSTRLALCQPHCRASSTMKAAKTYHMVKSWVLWLDGLSVMDGFP